MSTALKLMSFRHADRARFGIAVDEGVVDLGLRFPDAPTLRELIAADRLAEARSLMGEAPDFGWDEIRFDPVIPKPDKIICVGLNYRDHVEETGRTVTERPTLFARFSGSQAGHGEPMVKPRVSNEFDYEGELAVIIGRPGRHIAEADSLGHVAGYACYNDGSVRDWQRHTTQFLPGKTFASSGGFGPWMVSSEDIPDPTRLVLETRLNGVIVQHATTNLLIHPIPRLIAYISTIVQLEPGDVIVTGTPGGVGSKRTPPLWMKDGDVVEVEISEIGCLRNPVVAEH